MPTETKIVLGTIYNGDFDDYRNAAEDMTDQKGLPVQFEYSNYIFTVEKKK